MADLSKDVLLFAAEKRRMCKAFPECRDGCPLHGKICHIGRHDGNAEQDKQILSTVQQWHDERPPRTYAQDFFEKFPNAKIDTDDTPSVCRNYIYGIAICPKIHSMSTCIQCWNEPMTEDNT